MSHLWRTLASLARQERQQDDDSEEIEAQQLVPSEETPRDIADPTVIDDKGRGDNKSMQRVVLAVAFYWVVSLSLVFINKLSMSSNEMLRDVPLFFSWTQLLISVACCFLSSRLPYFRDSQMFPPVEYNTEVARNVLPLTLIFIGMISFNNLCLKHVELSFYQVARSLTILFNIAFTRYFDDKWPSARTIACCCVIVLGYTLGVQGEYNDTPSASDIASGAPRDLTFKGVVFGLLSSMFVALFANYVKRMLPFVDNNSQRLLVYNNVNAALMFPIAILAGGEFRMISLSMFFSGTFWLLVLTAGVLGFLIGYATMLQIHYTSPLTHNVSGTCKACVQTLIALAIFQDEISALGILGFLLVIIGSFLYSQVRYSERTPENAGR